MVSQRSVALCVLSIIPIACDKTPTVPTSPDTVTSVVQDTVVSALPDTVTSAAPDTVVSVPDTVTSPSQDTIISVAPDFVGKVLTPKYFEPSIRMRRTSQPVQGAEVTIVTGPRTGEKVETDQDGRYSFPEFDGDELHLRLEKEGYETKEAIVHRTKPTTLPDRVPLLYEDGLQKNPGTVIIGLRWPDYIRPLLEEQMEVIPDLLLMFAPAYDDGRHRSYYDHGVVAMTNPHRVAPNDPRGLSRSPKPARRCW